MKKSALYLLSLIVLAVTTSSAPGTEGKNADFKYDENIDEVGALNPGPSGTRDYHLRITGVNPDKAIANITVKAVGLQGIWQSDATKESLLWRIHYFRHKDFVKRAGIAPLTNTDGQKHKGLSDIDMLFESDSSNPEGMELICELTYEDKSTDTWEIKVPFLKNNQPKYKFTYKNNLLNLGNNYECAEFWHPLEISAKSFWNILEPSWGKQILLVHQGKWIDISKAGFDKLPMVQNSAMKLNSSSYFFPLTIRTPNPKSLKGRIPYLSKICVREMQVFNTNGKEISSDAIAYGECDGGGFDFMQRINDADVSPEKPCSSNYPIIDGKQSGWISLNFDGQPVSIAKIIIYHGAQNGPSTAYTAKEFKLQYWTGKAWSDIPGTETQDNKLDKTEHAFTPVSTTKIRLMVTDQNGLYDYTKFPFTIKSPFLGAGQADKLIPKGKPFFWWYLGHDTESHFQWPRNPVVDNKGYQKWKKEHKNFLGFQIVEMDNDIPYHYLPWSPSRCEIIDGKVVGNDYLKRSKVCVMERAVPQPPKTREEAVEQMHEIFAYYKKILFDDASAFLGLSIWHHYGLEWGGTMTFFENGGGGEPPLPMQIAAARGAARQYGKPWGFYIANFVGNGVLNYLKDSKSQYYYNGTECGKSISLYKRQLFLAYLSGVNMIDYEHHMQAHFMPANEKEFKLSPHGDVVVEFYNFTERCERGTPYTPIALLMDYTHGWRHKENAKIFIGIFPPTEGDRMIDAYMHSIFPWDTMSREGYGYFMPDSKYGDIFDILLLNPPSGPINKKTIGAYKAAILLGDIKIDENAAKRLLEYVHNGGTLVINVKQLNNFFSEKVTGLKILDKTFQGKEAVSTIDNKPIIYKELPYTCQTAELLTAEALVTDGSKLPLVTRNHYGTGNLIVTLQHYMTAEKTGKISKVNSGVPEKEALPTINYILSLLSYEALPFIIDGKCEYLINKLPDGWLIGLFNNKGIYKVGCSAPVINTNEKAVITVKSKGKIKKAQECISDTGLAIKGESEFNLTIPPGEIRVIRIRE